ncbi:DsbA family oxidoreductase [Pseudomonas oryzihabitans]|uniref:DsbA family oxidoreductase n=1 Tax=Pseudomonas oryzihabitans TaxID=47885 RepID=UPI002861E981|nr:DsbA family oxidoreductase [Pseudomonas psychrotolerans]MDR6680022.1 putative DsbA family dithiol-disulfide isomerase [Pseudomonas psychrotolerans]
MTASPRVRLDVWSDYVCPFCYLALPQLARLQKEFGDRLAIEWHAFELRPDPTPTLDPAGDYLRRTWDRAVYPLAAEYGMTLRLPPVQPRSRLALEAAEFAREHDRFETFHLAVFQAFFEDGRDIGDLAVLSELARRSGLDAQALEASLSRGDYTDLVLHAEDRAEALGITAVPTLLLRPAAAPIEAAEALDGAVPFAQLAAAVRAQLEA